jgi:3-deoxy-D-manno-octulosonic-acid transferase
MFIYGIITTILFLLALPFYAAVRMAKGKFFGWHEKLGFLNYQPSTINHQPTIMLHGVSVGEVIALENLTKKIRETFPQCQIVVTTGTKTGQDLARKKYEGVADLVTYFPFDIPFCVQGFLDKVRPAVVLIAETEIWPTFAHQCHKRGIALYTINGRISDSTYKLYRFLTPFFKAVFKFYTGILTQSEEDREKTVKIGAPPEITKVMGNLKFDVLKNGSQFTVHGSPRIIIAGSTHKGEDEIILHAFGEAKKQFPDIKLLLAPRHITRVNEVYQLSTINYQLSTALRSEGLDFDKHDIIILDTLGELGKMYAMCEFAFIGGSFNKTGGHNPLECTVFNKPVVSGPSIHNFKDIYGILTRSGAGMVVKLPQELQKHMEKLLGDKEFYAQSCKNCENVFEAQKGAIDCVINAIAPSLKII